MVLALRIGLCVEGNSDLDFLQPLLERIVFDAARATVGVSFVPVAKRTQSAEDIASRICQAWVEGAISLCCIHRDADSRKRASSQRTVADRACQCASLGCAFPDRLCVRVVPFREIETWALCDGEALRRVLGVRRLAPDQERALDSPESIIDPKAFLMALAGRRRLPMASIAGEIDLALLRRFDGFAEFERCFAEACRDATTTVLR
jgi:hypothetical protein